MSSKNNGIKTNLNNLDVSRLRATKTDVEFITELRRMLFGDDVAMDHWKLYVDAWFKYYIREKGTSPSFANGETSALKRLMHKIRNKCREANIVWDKDTSVDTLNIFFNRIKTLNPWVYDHLTLKNIDSQFDIIYAAAKRKSPDQRARELDKEVANRFGTE
jgi:hypothetical protein